MAEEGDTTITLLARLVADVEDFQTQMSSISERMDTVGESTARTASHFSLLGTSLFTMVRLSERIEISQLRLENAQNSLANAQDRYNAAIEKFGANSRQAHEAYRTMEIAANNLHTRQVRVALSFLLVGVTAVNELGRAAKSWDLFGMSAEKAGIKAAAAGTAAAVGEAEATAGVGVMTGAFATFETVIAPLLVVILAAVLAFAALKAIFDALGLKLPSLTSMMHALTSAFKVFFDFLEIGFQMVIAGIDAMTAPLRIILTTLGHFAKGISELFSGNIKGAFSEFGKGFNVIGEVKHTVSDIQKEWGKIGEKALEVKNGMNKNWNEMINGADKTADSIDGIGTALSNVDKRRSDFIRLVYAVKDMEGNMMMMAGGIEASKLGIAGNMGGKSAPAAQVTVTNPVINPTYININGQWVDKNTGAPMPTGRSGGNLVDYNRGSTSYSGPKWLHDFFRWMGGR